jgi:15-cis-phytoene synthase/lycopene beta-cyclase
LRIWKLICLNSHLKYTIPPAIALTLLYRPLCGRIDIYKILFLIGVAVTTTTPWDSYLIRRKIWTYPPSVVIGPTFFSIPLEEVFFFFIQTYNTCLLFLLVNTPVFKPAYLVDAKSDNGRLRPQLRRQRSIGQLVILAAIAFGAAQVWTGGAGTYLGLILTWAGPFALLLWTLAHQFIGTLPSVCVWLPIVLPTLYLWIVDTLAMRRGTWSIESGTKVGLYVWPSLEIEEAFFFFATNVMIVFGLLAFENALAVQEAFPTLFPDIQGLPSPASLIKALLLAPEEYESGRIEGMQEAVQRLKAKSRSFYLASSVFRGRLRIDLITLLVSFFIAGKTPLTTCRYSFCRVADDLVDNAESKEAAESWIVKLGSFLDQRYSASTTNEKTLHIQDIINEFPVNARSALTLLPTQLLSPEPLYELLKGFVTDLEFPEHEPHKANPRDVFPIEDESDLELYASRVAGTVAQMCIELVFHHCTGSEHVSPKERKYLIESGGQMGIALQYVNIARDVLVDARIGRVYLPTDWLEAEGLDPKTVIGNPDHPLIEKLRTRLLGKAFNIYHDARGAIEKLPEEGRAPMRVAVDSYMEIGKVLGEKGYKVKAGRATVPKSRRIRVAWRALNRG